MQKTILVTGATDGIGMETARMLISMGQHVLLHGRNREKLEAVEKMLDALPGEGRVESYLADLSSMSDVNALARTVAEKHDHLDVLINNAGILKTATPVTKDALDVRFVVNTLAPYLLTQKLLHLLGASARVINLSSAAQSPVDPHAMTGGKHLADMDAYAQSKLAITMWSRNMALSLKDKGPIVIAVNPGSLLGTRMVKEGFGMAGKDIGIGADILVRASLDDEFATATGLYFDNDSQQFASPHPDALDPEKTQEIVSTIEAMLEKLT